MDEINVHHTVQEQLLGICVRSALPGLECRQRISDEAFFKSPDWLDHTKAYAEEVLRQEATGLYCGLTHEDCDLILTAIMGYIGSGSPLDDSVNETLNHVQRLHVILADRGSR